MMSLLTERRALQSAIAVAACVPIAAGLLGAFQGPQLFELGVAQASDALASHMRYLSGILAAIGFCFWSFVPQPERHLAEARLLTLLVVCGGLCRLFGAVQASDFSLPVLLPLCMELGVTPLIYLWIKRVASVR